MKIFTTAEIQKHEEEFQEFLAREMEERDVLVSPAIMDGYKAPKQRVNFTIGSMLHGIKVAIGLDRPFKIKA